MKGSDVRQHGGLDDNDLELTDEDLPESGSGVSPDEDDDEHDDGRAGGEYGEDEDEDEDRGADDRDDEDDDDRDDEEDRRRREDRDRRRKRGERRAPQTASEDSAFARMRRAREEADRRAAQAEARAAEAIAARHEFTVSGLEEKIKAQREAVKKLREIGDPDAEIDAQMALNDLQMSLIEAKRKRDEALAEKQAAEDRANAKKPREQDADDLPEPAIEFGVKFMIMQWPQEVRLLIKPAMKSVAQRTGLQPDDPAFYNALRRELDNRLSRVDPRLSCDALRKIVHRNMWRGGAQGKPAQANQPPPSGDSDGGSAASAPRKSRGRALTASDIKMLKQLGYDPNDPAVAARWLKAAPEPIGERSRRDGRRRGGDDSRAGRRVYG